MRKPRQLPAYLRATRVKASAQPSRLYIGEMARRLDSKSADEPVPPTLGLRPENYINQPDAECPPVIVALRKLAELRQSTWRQWIEEFTRVKIYVRRFRKLDLYWSVNRYFFVETNLLHDTVRASLIYDNRDSAMWHYNNNQIAFIESYPITQEVKVPSVS